MKAIYQPGYDNEMAICALAQKSTQQKILHSMCHRRKEIVNRWLVKADKAPRGGKGGWIKGIEGRLAADRLLHLFLTMHGRAKLDQELTPTSLLNIHLVYQALYPGFDMHPNRIFYFFPQIRQQLIMLEPECSDCGRPYVVYHDEDASCCSACTIKATAQAEAANDQDSLDDVISAEA
jgi:hypothetical protein